MTARHAVLLCLVLLAVVASACASLSRVPSDVAVSPVRISTASVSLRGEPFEIHLAQPVTPRQPGVLVLYASGDGGWFGAAVEMFKAIAGDGFYVVGLSSRSLLHHKLSPGRTPVVAELAEDYRAILEYATSALQLPADHRVILSGWSRGASLAVLAGAARHAAPNVAGIVAIGLTEDENLGVGSDTDDDASATPTVRSASTLDLYPLLAEVAPRRVAVIQSTGDAYLRAARARELFGADTDDRRFYEVAAKNHRFSGGAAAFAAALRSALAWVSQ
jgi:type IV secretory pathway VirJ component